MTADCQPLVFIVGFGNMGRKIHSTLEGVGISPCIIDPKPLVSSDKKMFVSVDDALSVMQDERNSYWFICTPTDLHFSVFEKILSRFPHAKLMLEKPVVHSAALDNLKGHLKAAVFPHNLWVNNHYAACAILEYGNPFLIDNRSPIKKISVEFAKNRAQDVLDGRFVDHDYGVWGYEGFHMIYLASYFLSQEEKCQFLSMEGEYQYLSSGPSGLSWSKETANLPCGVQIDLRTSIDGSTETGNKTLNAKERLRRMKVLLNNGDYMQFSFSEMFDDCPHLLGRYSFSYINAQGIEEKAIEIEDNPLKSQILDFINDEQRLEFSLKYGLLLTERLSAMSKQAHPEAI